MNRSRRSVLRGVGGVVLGLPFLEGVAWRQRSAFAASPRRLAVLWQGNGVNMERFWPTATFGPLSAASFNADSAVAPLKDHAARIIIPRGMNMTGAGGHNGVVGGLTATAGRPWSSNDQQGTAWATGPSIDRVLAPKVNPQGRAPLALKSSNRPGGSIFDTVSYFGADKPAALERNPWVAYKDLIGLGGSADGQAVDLLTRRRKSVLDIVHGRLELLSKKELSASDRQKLDMHFSGIRSLETALNDAGFRSTGLPEARVTELKAYEGKAIGDYKNYAAIGRMQLDIVALAFASDVNRIGIVMWGSEAGGPAYVFDGLNVPYTHHALSHGDVSEDASKGKAPNAKAALLQVDQWHAAQMKHLIDKLSAYPDEGGKTVLDNSVVVWMNAMGDGDNHSSQDMPVVLAGGLGGYLKPGHFVDVRTGTSRVPHNMLLTTLMNGMGVPETHFGQKDIGRDGEVIAIKA